MLTAAALWLPLGFAAGEVVPEALVAREKSLLVEIGAMILSDPYLMKEFGVVEAAGLNSARLAWDRGATVEAIDFERLPEVKRVGDALIPTEQLSVPFCLGARCVGIAMFRVPRDGASPELLSVGDAGMALALAELEKRWAKYGPRDTPYRVVYLLGPQIPFAFAEGPRSGEEWLLTGTAADERDLRQAAGTAKADGTFVDADELRAYAAKLLAQADPLAEDAAAVESAESAGPHLGATPKGAADVTLPGEQVSPTKRRPEAESERTPANVAIGDGPSALTEDVAADRESHEPGGSDFRQVGALIGAAVAAVAAATVYRRRRSRR